MRELVHRIEAATPPDRDRAIDALRAFAILGVVLGHWLVTALVFDSGTVHGASPLQHMPQLAPISWAFQTLAVFFLVGGQVATKSYASARARGTTYGQWLRARLGRLFRPVAAVLTVWLVAAGGMLATQVSPDVVHTLVKLVLSPLWFLLVFATLTAATPIVCRVHPLWPLAVVLYVDVYRFGYGGAAWTGWINVAAGWLVPYCLGALWARRGAGTSLRATGWVLLVGGAVATALLVLFAGYPASMVGVPGAAISNLNPPTLAAVTFGLAQCGAALLLLGPLRRVLQPARAVGGGGAGQPVRDDDLPVAPDVDDGRHLPRPAHGWHAARTAHRARRRQLDPGPARLAAGVRADADGVLADVPYVRTAPARGVESGARRASRPNGGDGACLG